MEAILEYFRSQLWRLWISGQEVPANAIVEGNAPVNGCPVGGADVGAKVGEIMGISAEAGENSSKSYL